MCNTVACTLAVEYAQYSRGVAYTNWRHWLGRAGLATAAAELPTAAITAGASAAVVCIKPRRQG